MQHETTPNDNQVALPEIPEPQKECWIGHELFTADQLRAYALEAVRMNQAAGGEAVAWQYRFRAEDIDLDWVTLDTPLPDSLINDPEWEVRALYTAPPAAQVQPINRDSVVRGATLRAACYQLVELVEGRRCIRWQDANGFRLKDSNEWVAFYVAVKNVQNFTSVTHPAADTLGAARELVAKWRDAAEGSTDSPNPTVKAVARCHIELATELESALAQAPAVWVTDEMVEAALAEFRGLRFPTYPQQEMRAALEAALGQGKGS